MNRPKDARLLAALAAATVVLGAGAAWTLWDWSADLSAGERSSRAASPESLTDAPS